VSIENRDLKPGTRLVARYKGQEHTAEVVKTEAGIRYRLADGKEFKSPSAAGSAIMGGNACNGWRFWSLEEDGPRTERKPVARKKSAQPAKEATKSGRKPANGKGLIRKMDDGRYFCSSCMDAFDAPAGVEPLGCPRGHSAQAA
jgi:hypothetical protein